MYIQKYIEISNENKCVFMYYLTDNHKIRFTSNI